MTTTVLLEVKDWKLKSLGDFFLFFFFLLHVIIKQPDQTQGTSSVHIVSSFETEQQAS